MAALRFGAFVCLLAIVSAQITPEQNFLPVSFTVSSGPYDIIATPITPVAPYSQAAYQCNVTGDARFPPYASGTFPLTLSVPVGQRVRVIFANGNLGNGASVTQQGEPGVIVQQSGSPIVQQAGGASPIVQNQGSPIVQQGASGQALVVQQTPTVVQQPQYPQAPTIPNPPVVQQSPIVQQSSVVVQSPPSSSGSSSISASISQSSSSGESTSITQSSPSIITQSTPGVASAYINALVQTGRKMLQDRVPGGPNNGLVEYVALASANTVPGFFAGSTQFGVPYVEFTATEAARGQTATFRGALEVAVVTGGAPEVPFRRNPNESPECQVNVNFKVA